jgi:hypothetical protein
MSPKDYVDSIRRSAETPGFENAELAVTAADAAEKVLMAVEGIPIASALFVTPVLTAVLYEVVATYEDAIRAGSEPLEEQEKRFFCTMGAAMEETIGVIKRLLGEPPSGRMTKDEIDQLFETYNGKGDA